MGQEGVPPSRPETFCLLGRPGSSGVALQPSESVVTDYSDRETGTGTVTRVYRPSRVSGKGP